MPLMNKSEYAKHRRANGLSGGSAPAVHYAIQDGRIRVNSSGLIDSAQADQDWAVNSNPKRVAVGLRGGAARAAQRVEEKTTGVRKPGRPKNQTLSDVNKSRATKEFYEAGLARLKFEEREKSLIPSFTVKKVMYEAGRIVRAGHDSLVLQLAPELASEVDISAVERRLKIALDQLDNELANRIEQLAKKLLAVEGSAENDPDEFESEDDPESSDDLL